MSVRASCWLALAVLLGAAVGGACHDEPEPCGNGTCVCPVEHSCDVPCAAPPCHLDCEERSDCTGECANGDCTCRVGAMCAFECAAPPCHVKCEGDHPRCDGACANGTCSCGPDSTCAFVCDAPPCHAECEAGSTCTLACPSGYGMGCDFTRCAAGEPTVCDDGQTASCGAPCPG